MPRQMIAPTIKEVSGVDHPAHLLEGWLLIKNLTGIKSETLDNKGTAMPKQLSEEVLAALPEDVQAYVKSLEDNQAAPVPAIDDEAEAYEKAMASLPAAVRERMAADQRKQAETENLAKSLYEERESKRFEDMAKELSHLPKVGEGFAKSLRAAHDASPDAFTPVFEVLKAADTAIEKSALFTEIGSGIAATPGSAQEAVEAIAKSLQEKDPELSDADALVKAVESNRHLYSQHRQEA